MGEIRRHGVSFGGGISVDSSLDASSERPLQNKTITTAINAVNSKLNGIETGAQVNKIESISLNGTDFSIDSSTKKASGSVATCSPFPSGTVKNGTTLQLCTSLIATGEAKIGMMFMETITLTDSPSGGRAEVLVRVMGTEEGDEVLYLEMHSANTKERNWVAMYYDGYMEWGDTDCPWFAYLLVPIETYDKSKPSQAGVLLKKYTAASQQYVEDTIGTHNIDTTAHPTEFNAKADKNPTMNEIPTSTSAYELQDSCSYQHVPLYASTYTLPNIVNDMVGHSIMIDVYFSHVTSIAFQSESAYEMDKSIEITSGDVWRFMCNWFGHGWRIFPLKMKVPVLTVTTPVAISGTVGTPIAETGFTASASDHAQVRYSSSDLPDGITLVDGKLNGTINTAGTYTSTVVASSNFSVSKNITVNFTIS